MKRFGTIGLVFVGFVAGLFYVYSCGGGGGGSSALAETDVTGIETRLDTISNQITSLHNSIAGADIITVTALDFVDLADDAPSIFSEPISTAGYKEIYFMNSGGSIVFFAHHTVGGVTQTIQMDDDYGTMPTYGDSLVFEANNVSGVDDGWLVVKLIP